MSSFQLLRAVPLVKVHLIIDKMVPWKTRRCEALHVMLMGEAQILESTKGDPVASRGRSKLEEQVW